MVQSQDRDGQAWAQNASQPLYNQKMADQLYLSLWYPNFRFAALPSALVAVLRQFAVVASAGSKDDGTKRIVAASAYPLDWTESPVYQRVYVNDKRAQSSADTEGSIIENAVAEATEQLHEDSAYEFEMRWGLWLPEGTARHEADAEGPDFEADHFEADGAEAGARLDPAWTLDPTWRLEPTRVRVIGFGPEFDNGTYETNGHIRVDFGLDTPFTLEDELLEGLHGESHGESRESGGFDRDAALRIQQNVEKLLAFTLSVEKHCGISSRLLWTESGEPLAEKLIARLQRLN